MNEWLILGCTFVIALGHRLSSKEEIIFESHEPRVRAICQNNQLEINSKWREFKRKRNKSCLSKANVKRWLDVIDA